MTRAERENSKGERSELFIDFTASHHLAADEVVRLLESDLERGLNTLEAKRRFEKFGPNMLSPPQHASALQHFLLQFAQPLMYILLIAAAVTAFLGEYVDSAVIAAVVFINAIAGFLQESKAERAIEALSQMVLTEATVRRNGAKVRINSAELVPGDVVLLQAGDRVPADLRLFRVRNLKVDEAPLTGESVPVHKHSNRLVLETILADRKNLAFAGTLVTSGQAEGLVWAAGDATETGRIARLVQDAVVLETPLTRKIAQLSKLLLWVILALAAITFGIGVARGGSIEDMFLAAIALAVGAIPEGLPAAVTITLAIGVSRMARRRAIIRKLPAVEALGSTTVICSDKTGTLTENQMTVQQIYAGSKFFDVSGRGYEPAGRVTLENRTVAVEEQTALGQTLLAGVLNNDSQIARDGDRLVVEGDPTEGALIVAAQKAGLVPRDIHVAHPRMDVIPFESEHQFMATLHARGVGKPRVIYKKGSAERVLERCSEMLCDDGSVAPLNVTAVRAAVEEMAAKGLRVLAFARREVPHDHQELHHEHVKRGLTFLGLQGMIDPPRAEAIASVRKCRQAGIQVKMITGDHALTASTIARELGLGSSAASRELEPNSQAGSFAPRS